MYVSFWMATSRTGNQLELTDKSSHTKKYGGGVTSTSQYPHYRKISPFRRRMLPSRFQGTRHKSLTVYSECSAKALDSLRHIDIWTSGLNFGVDLDEKFSSLKRGCITFNTAYNGKRS
jgi:hypothetical protein